MPYLSDKQISMVANDVLQRILGGVGFTEAQVHTGEDFTGEEAVFVTARFDPGAGVTPGNLAGDAISMLRDTLIQEGDNRFPYLDFQYSGDHDPPLGEEEISAPSRE
jgi:hypothetical protein